MFQETNNKISFNELEEGILKFWEGHQIFEKSLKLREDAEEFVFYDGPPFATGLPHYGHLLAGTLKDIIPRYQTMRGHYVERRFGWDCHGLPVEYEMEKELNLSGKREIESYGIDRFNESCRSIVLRYTAEWEKTVRRMGRWVDFKHDYKTMDLAYMESIWWVFSELWQRGLIYEGYKVLPYCPRCATPLSNFETNQGYREVTDPAITVRFTVKNQSRTHFLAWTTTPWTLPSNLALAVGASIEYVKIKDQDEYYIMAKDRLSSYYRHVEEYEIIERFQGGQLVGMEYEPLFPYFADWRSHGAFRVVSAEFVSTEDGTGIVHIAPAFGEDDFNVCRENGIPVVMPVDDEGKFTSQTPEYNGEFVKDADPHIIKRLKDEGKLVKREQVHHNYPHCWRCDSPLIYRAISTWFVRVDLIKAKMLTSNQEINWVPAHLKEGRFGKWLENARDWAISRNRYWGTPIPIWRCGCGETLVVGSVEELKLKSGVTLTDLHKHFADKVTIPCPACQKPMNRIPEVFDCWFESGSMPYAQNHYPFEHKQKFEQHFPADFIAEGLDQTRGWFYTLIVLSSALFGRPAFKNVIVNGLILAEDGKKMSKRLKNYPDPEYLIQTYGADALRLYFVSSPVVKAEDLRFTEEGVREILRTVIIPLWNAYSFLATYAGIDRWQPDLAQLTVSNHQLDRWIISAMNRLLEELTGFLDQYDLQRSIGPMLAFIDQLTNWYIRRSRRRFWKSENDRDKESAYSTLYYILLNLSKVMAPFIPFMAEMIYQNLRTEEMPESVHLCDFPLTNSQLRDFHLEQKMQLAQRAVSMGRALRTKHNLKIRQSLKYIHLITTDELERFILAELDDLIKEELNVRELVFDENESALVMYSAKADFKKLGPRYGANMKALAGFIQNLSSQSIGDLLKGNSLQTTIQGQAIELTGADLVINRVEKEGLIIENEGTLTVVLDTHLSQELIEEGLIRELVHQIQNLRKDNQFEVSDRIRIRYKATEKLNGAIEKLLDYLKNEVLATDLVEDEAALTAAEISVNDEKIRLILEKSS